MRIFEDIKARISVIGICYILNVYDYILLVYINSAARQVLIATEVIISGSEMFR